MPFIEANGANLYYESHGDGPAIVFAHGAGGNHLSWWQQVPYFRERYRCITFDHRGFGRSADPGTTPAQRAFPEDLRALLDGLRIERAFLVAQSMGGSTCLGFTMAYPERVLGLVMADTTGTIDDDGLRERCARSAIRSRGHSPCRGVHTTRPWRWHGRTWRFCTIRSWG